MSEGKPKVVLRGVTRRYGSAAAIEDIDLDIAEGSFVALVGGSGSGKSTLLKTINRLVAPDEGTVMVADAPADAIALRRAIGYVIQEVGLFPHMSVAANIAIGPRLAGRHCDTGALLDLVDLPRGFAERSPASLSGGQRQRVGVARALATDAKVMLMDEPFGALDPVTRDALGTIYRALHKRLGLTTIMVTHDMAEALLLADRVVVMERGRVGGDATPAELLHGGGGAAAQALVAVPKAQAERLAAL